MYVFISELLEQIKYFKAKDKNEALYQFEKETSLSSEDFLEIYGHCLCYTKSTNNDLLFIDTVENLV